MTPDMLKDTCLTLYGWGWQSALARELGMSSRQIRRYASGRDPIPRTVELAIAHLKSAHQSPPI